MKVKPLGNKVLVQRLEAEERTKGGIVLPDSAKEKPREGKIVSIGKGKIADDGKTIPMFVKEGDKILFQSYAGTEIKIDGEEYLILAEEDILAIIEK
jgi:chaperonin GroES